MKNAKKIAVFAVVLAVFCTSASAQWVVTNPISDALSQAKEAAAYAQRADSIAKQALQYQNQILQYQAMLKHLQENPLGAVLPNLTLLATNTARIIANGESLANNMSSVSDNMKRAFKNPQGDFGVQFRVWSNVTKEALSGAMLNAGLVREQFKDDTTAIQALITKNQASQGDLGALKTLGEFSAAQLQESIKLRDLISAQQLAVNNSLMAANAEAMAAQTAADNHFKEFVPRTPGFSSSGGKH